MGTVSLPHSAPATRRNTNHRAFDTDIAPAKSALVARQLLMQSVSVDKSKALDQP